MLVGLTSHPLSPEASSAVDVSGRSLLEQAIVARLEQSRVAAAADFGRIGSFVPVMRLRSSVERQQTRSGKATQLDADARSVANAIAGRDANN
jgi:hypothetical protein